MEWMKFLDTAVMAFVVYIPLLIGKSKRSEESLFWASLISLSLSIIVFFLIKTGNVEHKELFIFPLLIALIFGFIAYWLYRLNFSWEIKVFSPITWLVVLPIVDNLIFRRFGLYYTSKLPYLSYKLQLLFWHVRGNVILLAVLCAFIYFLIFVRKDVFQAIIEGTMAFVVSVIAGHVYLFYGLFGAILAQSAFSFWRMIFVRFPQMK